jgi:nucleolar protein 4
MRQKLKNPNIFVSTTRLCVRNIPTAVDDRALKKVFLKAADNPKANITEVCTENI